MSQAQFFQEPQFQAGLSHRSLNAQSAILLVIQPRTIPQQVLRPYVYNFNSPMIQDMLKAPSVGEAVGVGNFMSANVGAAILPQDNGILMNTAPLSNNWTFVLMIDAMSASGATIRTITSGFFRDEPINPMTMQMGMTPALNPNAALQFMTFTSLGLDQTIGPRSTSQVHVRNCADITPAITNTFTNNEELFLIDPGDLTKATRLQTPEEQIECFGDLAVANQRNHAAVLPTRLKSPRHVLREIGDALDSASSASDAGSVISDMGRHKRHMLADPHETFVTTFRNNLVTSNNTTFVPSPIDVTTSMTLAQLDREYPHLQVQCVGVPHNVSGNDRPQQMICPQNILSYMIANTISAVAIGNAIGEISFRYCSYNHDTMAGAKGMWQIHGASLVCPASQDLIRECVEGFMRILTSDLWPIIEMTHGQFDIMVKHDAHGETYIDLQLLDFGRIDGLYVTHNNISGLVTPSIGTAEHLKHNAGELDKLINSIRMKYDYPPEGLLGSTPIYNNNRLPHVPLPFIPMHV